MCAWRSSRLPRAVLDLSLIKPMTDVDADSLEPGIHNGGDDGDGDDEGIVIIMKEKMAMRMMVLLMMMMMAMTMTMVVMILQVFCAFSFCSGTKGPG